MAIYACGHKIPDLDSISSAISLSYLKQQLADKQAELSKLEASSVSSTAGDTASGTDKNGGSKSKPKRLTFSLDKGWSEE